MERRWPCYAEALYTFDGEDYTHLPFKKGDLVVVSECDDENWWKGRISRTTKTGIFPSCLVYPTGHVVDDYDYRIELKISPNTLNDTYQAQAFSQAQLNQVRQHQETLMNQASQLNPYSNNGSHSYSQDFSTLNNPPLINGEDDLENQLLNMANNEIELIENIKNPKMTPIKLKLLYKDPNSNLASKPSLARTNNRSQSRATKALNTTNFNTKNISAQNNTRYTDSLFSSESDSDFSDTLSKRQDNSTARSKQQSADKNSKTSKPNNSALSSLNYNNIEKPNTSKSLLESDDEDVIYKEGDSIADEFVRQYMEKDGMVDKYFFHNNVSKLKTTSTNHTTSMDIDIDIDIDTSDDEPEPKARLNTHIDTGYISDLKSQTNNTRLVDTTKNIRRNLIKLPKRHVPSNSENLSLSSSTIQKPENLGLQRNPSSSIISLPEQTGPKLESSSLQGNKNQLTVSNQEINSSLSSVSSKVSYRQYLLDSGLDRLTKIKQQDSQRLSSLSPSNASINISTETVNKPTLIERYRSLKLSSNSSNPSVKNGSYASISSSISASRSDTNSNNNTNTSSPEFSANTKPNPTSTTTTNATIDTAVVPPTSNNSTPSPQMEIANDATVMMNSLCLSDEELLKNDYNNFMSCNSVFHIDSDSDPNLDSDTKSRNKHADHGYDHHVNQNPSNPVLIHTARLVKMDRIGEPLDKSISNEVSLRVVNSSKSSENEVQENQDDQDDQDQDHGQDHGQDHDRDGNRDVDIYQEQYQGQAQAQDQVQERLEDIGYYQDQDQDQNQQPEQKEEQFEDLEPLVLPKISFTSQNRFTIKGPRLMNSEPRIIFQATKNSGYPPPSINGTLKTQTAIVGNSMDMPSSVANEHGVINMDSAKANQSISNSRFIDDSSLDRAPSSLSYSNDVNSYISGPNFPNRPRQKKLPSKPSMAYSVSNYPTQYPTTENYTSQEKPSSRMGTNVRISSATATTTASQTPRKPPPPVPPRFRNNTPTFSQSAPSQSYEDYEPNPTIGVSPSPVIVSNALLNNRQGVSRLSSNTSNQYSPITYNNGSLTPNRQNSALSNYPINSPSRIGAHSRTQATINAPLRNMPFSPSFANNQSISNNYTHPVQSPIQIQEHGSNMPQGLNMNVIRSSAPQKYYPQSTLVGGGIRNDVGQYNRASQFTLRSNTTDTANDLRMAQRMFTPFPSNIGTDQLPATNFDNSSLKASNSINSMRNVNKDSFMPGIKIPENIYGIIPGMIKIGIQFMRSQVAQADDPVLSAPVPYGVSPIQVTKNAKQVIKPGAKIAKIDEIDWASVDKSIQLLNQTMKSPKISLESVASRYIGRQYKDQPHHQVRAIFAWVTTFITFEDVESNADSQGKLRLHLSEMPEIVYEKKKSKGPGFAYLFHKIATLLNIECYVVHGTLKLPAPYPDSALSGPVYPSLPNHAWNVVCVDGEYRMIDTACASPSHPLNENGCRDDGFFLGHPRNFIYTHFPHDPTMQYLSPFVSWPVFWQLPCVRPAFFRHGVKLLNLVAPYLSIQDDALLPLIMCLKDSSMDCYAEVNMYESYSTKTSQLPVFPKLSVSHSLLAQCMNYENKRMVKVLVGANSADNRGVVKIYTGIKPSLLTKSAQVELMNIMAESDREKQSSQQNEMMFVEGTISQTSGKRGGGGTISNAITSTGTFSKRSRSNSALSLSTSQFVNPKQTIRGIFNGGRHKRVNSETKLKPGEIEFSSPFVIGAPNDKTYDLAMTLPLHHTGKPCHHEFILTNHFSHSEFYIKTPTSRLFDIGSSVDFHIMPSSTVSKHYKLQLKSPSGHPTKFVFQPSDQSYTLTHTVREAGNWIIVYHSDTDGWVPIVMYQCK